MEIEKYKEMYLNLGLIPDDRCVLFVEYAEKLDLEEVSFNVPDLLYEGYFHHKGGTYLVFRDNFIGHDYEKLKAYSIASHQLYGNDSLIAGKYPSSVYNNEKYWDRLTCGCEHCSINRLSK